MLAYTVAVNFFIIVRSPYGTYGLRSFIASDRKIVFQALFCDRQTIVKKVNISRFDF